MLNWLFGKEKKMERGTALIAFDMHSHLIPGIDDGVKTLDQSIEIIRNLHAHGYRYLVTTPHIMQGGFDNTPEIIYDGLEKVRARLAAENIPVRLDAAAEYYFDDNFISLARAGNLMTFGDRYVLFELPATAKPRQLEDLIFVLNTQGYRPILAHPERYTYLHSKGLSMYADIKDFGIQFQCNILSFTGYYSERIQQTAQALCDAGMVDWVGSDIHNERHTGNVIQALQDDYLYKISRDPNLMNHKMAAPEQPV